MAEALNLTQLQPHPRLILTNDQVARILGPWKDDPCLARLVEALKSSADAVLEEPVVEHKMIGRRLLSQSRACLRKTLYTAAAYRLGLGEAYGQRAKQEILAAARLMDWNPSHFLDVAEMAAAVALGYDWLQPLLSEEEKTELAQALIKKALEPGALKKKEWWWTRDNNWNQVCLGGLALSALALADRHPDLSRRYLTDILANLKHGLSVYRPNGVYPEGPSYWDYGTQYSVLTQAAFKTALDLDAGIFNADGFKHTFDFRRACVAPTGNSIRFADAGTGNPWFGEFFLAATELKRPDLGIFAAAALTDYLISSRQLKSRLAPLTFGYFHPASGAVQFGELAYFGSGRVDLAMLRNGWRAEDTWITLKAGYLDNNHGHLDNGQIEWEADGVRWIEDLGKDDQLYEDKRGEVWSMKQNSARWEYLRCRNQGHSTLTIGDALQRVEGHSRLIRRHSAKNGASHAVADLSASYAGQANRVWRGIQLTTDGGVLVHDEIQGAKQPIRWKILTPAKIELGPDHRTVILNHKEKQARLQLLNPENAKFTTEPVTVENFEEPLEFPINALQINVPPTDDVAIRVWLVPGSKVDLVNQPPPPMALNQWATDTPAP